MTVTPTGDRLTFSVTSTDDKDNYTVDMAADGGNAACTCRDWQCRRSPQYRKTKTIVDYGTPLSTRCKHINAVLLYLGNCVVNRANGKS